MNIELKGTIEKSIGIELPKSCGLWTYILEPSSTATGRNCSECLLLKFWKIEEKKWSCNRYFKIPFLNLSWDLWSHNSQRLTEIASTFYFKHFFSNNSSLNISLVKSYIKVGSVVSFSSNPKDLICISPSTYTLTFQLR